MNSENDSEKGRGRPRVVGADVTSIYSRLFPNVRSRRGLVNMHYQGVALEALGRCKESEFHWITGDGITGMRRAILQELGRLEDDEAIRCLARLIVRDKPRGQAAIARIRRARTGTTTGSILGLANKIIGVINAHLTRYPATQTEDLLDAIATAEAQVEELALGANGETGPRRRCTGGIVVAQGR